MSKQSATSFWMPAVWTAAIIIAAAGAIAGSSYLRSQHKRPLSSPKTSASAAEHGRIRAHLDALPLAFEANQGQADPQVKYMARGNGYKLFLTSSKAIMTLSGSGRQSEVLDMMMNKRRGPAAIKAMLKKRANGHKQASPVAVLEMNFLGTNSHPQLVAEEHQAGKVNYYIGKDPANWHSNVPLYGRVTYRNVYPGVDLAFHGASKQFEFDYVVSPAADPKTIALGFDGAASVQSNESGDLILATAAGRVQLHKPIAYQVKNGEPQLVNAKFVLKSKNEVAFEVGAYDRSRELIIDPTVVYSTYFGGGNADYGMSIAADASGNAFVAGATDSSTIPGSPTPIGGFDVFVTEIDPNGKLLATTLLGGSGDEFPGGIAIDSTGVYVAGTTASASTFPATVGQACPGGSTAATANDAFAVQLDLSLKIVWGTCIAGSSNDSGLGVAVDSAGDVYVVGETFSSDLGGAAGGVNPLPNGNALNRNLSAVADDGYIAVLNPIGTTYLMVSYLGGSDNDLATGVGLDASGNIYVAGETLSPDLPTVGGVQSGCGTDGNCNTSGGVAQDDAFIASIAPIATNPSQYNYFTYYGGSGVDDAFAIAADAAGNAFVTGRTTSTDLLSAGTTFQNSLVGTQNAFILQLNSAGNNVAYNTYFGGDGSDAGLGIALDASDTVYLTGQTSSSGASFPLLNPIEATGSGNTDVFVSVLSVANNQLLFSTFLGGGGDEDQLQGAIAIDGSEYIYVTGDTDSSDFPTAVPSGVKVIDGTYGGGTCTNSVGNLVPCPDAFVAEYSPATAPDFTLSATALTPASVPAGGSATSTVTVTPLNGYAGTVNLTCAVAAASGNATVLPSCSFSGDTLTVKTGGSAAAIHRSSGIFYAMWLPVLGLSLAGVGLSGAERRRKKLFGIFLLGLMMTALFFLPACSSSTTTVGGCNGCATGGSYTVSVTGTDSANTNLTHDLVPPLTLTVQ